MMIYATRLGIYAGTLKIIIKLNIMILFLKNPENYIIFDNSIHQVRGIKQGCDDCPNCKYYKSPIKTIKVSKCKNH